MTNQTKLLIYSILSFVLFLLIVGCSSNQTATEAQQQEIETYSYIVTSINNEGLKGDSLTDDTGIYLTPETIEGMNLKVNDQIEVSFPKDDFETITKVSKIN
jgi:hypothetical protein